MKKILYGFLSLVLCMGMSTTVMAKSPITDDNGTDTKNVIVKVDQHGSTPVYSVDVEWDDLTFNYRDENGTWNPENHTVANSNGTWIDGDRTINITNHSNVPVTANVKFGDQDSATQNGVTATLTGNSGLNLKAGVLHSPDTADNKTATVTVSGTPTVQGNFTVGTITVTVTAATGAAG